jgi:hypothetical protein
VARHTIHIDDRKCTLCAMGAVQDEHHVLFVCPALSPVRLDFPLLLFRTLGLAMFRICFKVDRSSGQDWRSVLREMMSLFGGSVGGVFKPIHCVGALDDIRHGIELNSDAEVD